MKMASCLLIVVLLTSCQSALAVDLLSRSGSILYFDDFSDPTSGWLRVSNSFGRMEYDSGSYRIKVDSPHYDLWSVSGHTYRDVKVEADAVSLAALPQDRLGLVCRYHDPKNYYFFIVTNDGYYTIGKVIKGALSLLDENMMTYSPYILTGTSPNHLRFDCSGKTLTGYANGQAISVAKDASLSRGDAGVIAGSFDQPGVDVVFDNFVVYKP